MTMLWETTNKDLLRWQLAGQRTLTKILMKAWKENLPGLCWTVGTTSMLVGTVEGFYPEEGQAVDRYGRADVRTQFDRWVAFGGAEFTEHTDTTGTVRLRAKFEWPEPDRSGTKVDVVILARIYPPEPTGGDL